MPNVEKELKHCVILLVQCLKTFNKIANAIEQLNACLELFILQTLMGAITWISTAGFTWFSKTADMKMAEFLPSLITYVVFAVYLFVASMVHQQVILLSFYNFALLQSSCQ